MKIIKFPAADETTACLLDVPDNLQALRDAIGAEKLRIIRFELDVCLVYDSHGAEKELPFIAEIPGLDDFINIFGIHGDVLVVGIGKNHLCDVPDKYIDFVFGGATTL